MPGGAALLPGMTWAGYFTEHMQNSLVFFKHTPVMCPGSHLFTVSGEQASCITALKNYPN